jgi:hypothetical protein
MGQEIATRKGFKAVRELLLCSAVVFLDLHSHIHLREVSHENLIKPALLAPAQLLIVCYVFAL